MIAQTKPLTAAEFDRIASQPDQVDRLLEFIGGEIVEVVSNNYSSEVAALLLFFIQHHLRQANIQGRVTGADGGYMIGED